MHLRKSLVTAAAALAVGLLGLGVAATAYTSVEINGVSTPAATDTVTGAFTSGTVSFSGGGPYGCTAGSVGGSAWRSPTPVSSEISFGTLTLTCVSTPVGTATISLNSCTVPVNIDDTAGVGAGLTDTAVPGVVTFGSGTCVQITALFGYCTVNLQDSAQGPVTAKFNETVKTGNWQDLTLNGTARLSNQSAACSGLMTGAFTFNNVVFNVQASAGAINFRP